MGLLAKLLDLLVCLSIRCAIFRLELTHGRPQRGPASSRAKARKIAVAPAEERRAEHCEQRDFIQRILEHAQGSENVLHFTPVEELSATILDEWDAEVGESALERGEWVARVGKNRDV